MKPVSKHYKFILFLLILFGSVQLSAQVWKVDQLSSKIESGVDNVNNKARIKDIEGALNDLDKLNTELRFSLPEFPDWYKTARENDKDYNFKVDAALASQLEVQYWRNMLQKVERNKKGLNEAFSGIEAMKTLDAQDVAWSYLKTIYNAGKAIKDVVESASTGNLGGVFFNTKEGMDQFIEDYKNIENAELQGLETAQKEQELKLMISKAKAMERNYKRIEEKISSGLAVVESFNSNIESLYQLSEKLSKEAQHKIDWNDSRYNFNAQNYLQRIDQEKGRLENSFINWEAFKNGFLSIGKKAVQEKNDVVAAIQKTDDVAVKQAKLDDVEAVYSDYSKTAFETFRLLEQQYGTTLTEKINLNYQIDDFKPVPFPTGQNIDAGSAGATLSFSSVQAEREVQELVNLVHAEVNGVNELANRNQMETAVNRLNDLNRRFDRELGFSFAENYRKAREDNPDFIVSIEAQLSGRFKGAYWENSLKQNAAKLKDLRDRFYATPKSNARRYWEITYALCKSAYDMAQLKPDITKELNESGKKAAWDKLEEGTDGIKEDFKKIEKAFQMEYNTPENKAAIEALMKKVAITAEALEGLASYMKVNEEEAARFYALVDRFNSIKKEIESGPSKLISSDDGRYNFNETTFYNRAKQLISEFKEETLSWTEFDQKLNQLNREAEQQKEGVIKNLQASDDLESKKQQAINTETNDWDYYYSWAIEEHGKCFELNQQTQHYNGINAFAGAEETPQTNNAKANPFAGAPVENNSSNQESISLSTPDYFWDKQIYLNQIKNLASQFKQNGTDYYVLKAKIENINKSAEEAKDKIYQKIQNSGATSSFEKGEQLNEDFNAFYDLSFDILDECYRFDQNKEQSVSSGNNPNAQTQNSSSNNMDSDYEKYALDKSKYRNKINNVGKQYQDGEIDRSTFVDNKWQAILNAYNLEGQLLFGALRSNEEVKKAKIVWQNFSDEMQLMVQSYLDDGQEVTSETAPQNAQKTTSNTSNQGSNSLSTPPGTRKPNSLYHGRWVGEQLGRDEYHFDQNGSNVEIYSIGTGQIVNGVLVCKRPPNGDEYDMGLDYQFKLLGDGFTMEVKYLSFGNKYEIKKLKYWGMPKLQGADAEIMDKDMDGVPNNMDKCPNSARGLTVDNGGVDIAGCPTGQGQEITNAAVNQPANTTTGNTINPFDGAVETTENKNSSANPFAGAPVENNSSTSLNSSPNPFAGAGSGGSTSSTSKISEQANPNAQTQINTAKTPPPPGYIGTISNTGNGKGSYCSFAVSNFKQTDRIIFHVLSGDLKKTEIIWRTEGGSWRTKYEGPQTVFNASDYLKDLPDFITHLNFTVNARHNSSYLPNACEAEVWHLPPGAQVPSNWKKTINGGADKISDDFNNLIEKADEAFDKKYWNESQGARTTSNPKQDSYDLLRRSEQLIGQQANITTQYAMVSRLASKYAEYAKRVFANTAKAEFIQAAGKLLAQYGGKAGSLGSLKSNAYSNIAEGWQELTKAALWGDHEYNKMYCDKESKKYFNLATN